MAASRNTAVQYFHVPALAIRYLVQYKVNKVYGTAGKVIAICCDLRRRRGGAQCALGTTLCPGHTPINKTQTRSAVFLVVCVA